MTRQKLKDKIYELESQIDFMTTDLEDAKEELRQTVEELDNYKGNE